MQTGAAFCHNSAPTLGVQDRFHMTREQVVDAIRDSSDKSWVARALLPEGVQSYRAELTHKFIRLYGSSVQDGPFKEMKLPARTSWGDGDTLPKLLGCYEAELEPAVNDALKKEYGLVVNVGCAEGYYAIGLARRLPSTQVYAFDIDDKARSVCLSGAAINGVRDRMKVGGCCSAEILHRILSSGRKSLLFIDCEGDEVPLLRPDIVPGLQAADIIVECHDFIDSTITATLIERFSATHKICRVKEGERRQPTHPFLASLNSFEEALATCEFRPKRMHWLVLTSNHSKNSD